MMNTVRKLVAIGNNPKAGWRYYAANVLLIVSTVAFILPMSFFTVIGIAWAISHHPWLTLFGFLTLLGVCAALIVKEQPDE